MILYKFATRSRPEKFKRAICNIADNATQSYKILVSADVDDASMYNLTMMSWIKNHPKVSIQFGEKVSKIEAINRDMNKAKHWDILVNMSDDMKFLVKGFDERIVNAFKDDSRGFVHFPDGYTKELSTLSIMSRDYFKRDNYIYHSDYKSLWADNEATEVAKMRDEYKFVDEKIFEHQHPAWGKAVADDLLRESESHYHRDKEVYEKRKHLGFPPLSIHDL
jgi:hypothetical protein